MSRRFPLYAIALITPVVGQDALDPLILTATRSEMAAADLPYTVRTLDAETLRDDTRRTLPEALQYTPGVLVQKTAYGHGSPFIRGFTGRQNLLLVDGVRLNNSTWRGGPVQYWNTVDSQSIDRLELVMSQGSVLYGSDAIGGTLNAFTKSSDFRQQAEAQRFFHGSAAYEYRTNGEGSQVGRLETSMGVGGKYGLFLGLTGKDFGDIEDDSVGRMKNTGYPEQDLDFRLDLALSPDTTLTLAHQYVDQDDVWRWHRTTENPGWVHGSHVAAPGSFLSNVYDQERSLTYLKVEGVDDEESALWQRWSATLSWQKTQDSELQFRRVGDLRTAGLDLETYGLDLAFESRIGPGTLVYGLDYYVDEVDSEAYRNYVFRPTDRPVADDASYHLFGAFGQYAWAATERFTLTGGLRYTYAQAEWDAYRAAGAAQDQGGRGDWDDLSASLRGIYQVDDCWSVYGGLAQAFRAPNLNDLTGTTLALRGLDSYGSPDLDPEKYLTAELGTRYTSGDFSASLAGFYTWTRDAITGVVDRFGNSIATNGEEGYIYGFEGEGVWQWDESWMLGLGAAWNEGKTETRANGDRWITRLLPFSGTLRLRWTCPDERFWIEGRLLGAVGEDRIHAANQASDNQRIPTGGTPGYWVAMVHAGMRVDDHLELTAGVENLLDEDYRNHGSGQNEPGTNVILGARVSW
ncbi:hemoglobin/transferrin/lactoferrin receptor protein [Haloferula luteola]|uniref:Hemoglobin/transferrin/lactoferrin receptor protein n=1 Tax=Haloferula luteola TaxID=595692 RepID=A0A840UYU3_9BACT|nr:TonB-dependent receptor [Haloferula luteola]MBB5350905.1 hemoglobin/transferrin/lactoferrin receptor protein [Haloferula luteola]